MRRFGRLDHERRGLPDFEQIRERDFEAGGIQTVVAMRAAGRHEENAVQTAASIFSTSAAISLMRVWLWRAIVVLTCKLMPASRASAAAPTVRSNVPFTPRNASCTCASGPSMLSEMLLQPDRERSSVALVTRPVPLGRPRR